MLDRAGSFKYEAAWLRLGCDSPDTVTQSLPGGCGLCQWASPSESGVAFLPVTVGVQSRYFCGVPAVGLSVPVRWR